MCRHPSTLSVCRFIPNLHHPARHFTPAKAPQGNPPPGLLIPYFRYGLGCSLSAHCYFMHFASKLAEFLAHFANQMQHNGKY
jgi:hypothetical protein